MEEQTTLVIGAVDHPERYAYKAVSKLKAHEIPVIAYGIRPGEIEGVQIQTEWNPNWKVDTITLYINPLVQENYYEQIAALHPRRVIFNPGTENDELIKILEQHGIFSEVACTLVLLSIGQY